MKILRSIMLILHLIYLINKDSFQLMIRPRFVCHKTSVATRVCQTSMSSNHWLDIKCGWNAPKVPQSHAQCQKLLLPSVKYQVFTSREGRHFSYNITQKNGKIAWISRARHPLVEELISFLI